MRPPGAVAGDLLAFNTVYQPNVTPGRWHYVSMDVAVLSGSGENGHINLQVSADGVGGWITVASVGCRHEIGTGTEVISVNGQVSTIVPPGYRIRLQTVTINGYTAPEFVAISGFLILYPIF